MNKAEVCAELSVSERTVQRLTAQGKLPVRYENAPNGGRRPVFEAADVQKLKREMANGNSTTTTGQSVARIGGTGRLPAQFTQMLDGLLAIARANPAPASQIRATEKLTLTLAEAAELSGLSKGFLREAIRSKKLRSIGSSRRHRVRRADLEAFVAAL